METISLRNQDIKGQFTEVRGNSQVIQQSFKCRIKNERTPDPPIPANWSLPSDPCELNVSEFLRNPET